MESEFLLNLKEISIEIIIISILVFALTMLIKWPIKNATSNLSENKRQAVNTVIVFIPMILSFVLSILYFGIFEKQWFVTIAYEATGNSYILSVAIYAIYSRIVILIKGCKTEKNEDLSKETVAYIKQNIKSISQVLKIEEKDLTNTVNEIEKLLKIRNDIENNLIYQNIAQSEKLDNQLLELESKKEELTGSIEKKQIEIKNYQQSLSK